MKVKIWQRKAVDGENGRLCLVRPKVSQGRTAEE